MFRRLIHRAALGLCAVFFSCLAAPALGTDVTLSEFSSDATPANLLDAHISFNVSGSTLTLMVTNNTDNNVPTAEYNINEVYFNANDDVTSLSLNTSPTPGWSLVANASAGVFGTFEYKLQGGVGAMTPDNIEPGETATFTLSIVGSGVNANDFCSDTSTNPPGSISVIAACKFVNGPGDDSAFGGGGMVNGDCMTPPMCSIDPAGPVKITLGESVEFDVCGESFCDGDAIIEALSPPDWCEQVQQMALANAVCESYVCTPPAPGMYELNFRVTDDENDMTTDCSIMIEVNEEMCEEPPFCSVDPEGPAKITVGESLDVKITYGSSCDGDQPVFTASGVSFSFFSISTPTQNDQGEYCVTFTYSPELEDIGTYTHTYTITDPNNGQLNTCSFSFEVNDGEMCEEPPFCQLDQPMQDKFFVGDSFDVKVTYGSNCDDSQPNILSSGISFPFFTVSPVTPDGAGGYCVTYTYTPGPEDVGSYTHSYQITDPNNGLMAICSYSFEVNPPPCQDPPLCTIEPAGPIMAYVGEEFTFDVCGDSQCDGEIEITPLNLPDWCTDGEMRFDQECLTIACTPPSDAEGMYTFEFELRDTSNDQTTTCEIDVEIVCHLEPMCFFTEDGPLIVEVGEEIDFDFCGATVCDGNRARIEMSSRPPFIDPAGHLKGGVDEEICLPITGTPRSSDIGSWVVRVKVTDLDTGVESECDFRIIVTGPPQCEDRPVCTITPEEEIVATQGDSVSLEICAISACDEGTAMIELVEGPDFCDPFEPVTSEPGEAICADLTCVVPDDAEPGDYLVRFRVTDLENDRTTLCQTRIVVEASALFCVEQEPNDDFESCTILEAGDCLDLGCGANVVGILNIDGVDLDYYCLSGLDPLTAYRVTIVGGIDCDGAPVCAAIACLDSSGMIIDSTNSGGPMMGYPSIECVSDAGGFIQVAVSGCDDLDFDGEPDTPGDSGRGGIGHGSTGSYQVAIVPVDPIANNMACHADMNQDGMVDSADLGMLIGLFGEVCAP